MWMNCSRGSRPNTVGTTGSAKNRVRVVSASGPTNGASRSTVVVTSGRRRVNPRTYPSISMMSLANPPRGMSVGGVDSVKTAGSRNEAP